MLLESKALKQHRDGVTRGTEYEIDSDNDHPVHGCNAFYWLAGAASCKKFQRFLYRRKPVRGISNRDSSPGRRAVRMAIYCLTSADCWFWHGRYLDGFFFRFCAIHQLFCYGTTHFQNDDKNESEKFDRSS